MIGTGAAHIFAELDQPDTNLTAAAGRLPPARGAARDPQDLPRCGASVSSRAAVHDGDLACRMFRHTALQA